MISLMQYEKNLFFLRFANFYHRFIESYFKIVTLLHELIKSIKKKSKNHFLH